MISFREVAVRYPGQVASALDGVSCDAPRGRLTAVVGPNGSGKSTLVRALLGRVPLTKGVVQLDGADMRAVARRDIAQRVAVVTQREDPAFPIAVHEYVALGRYAYRGLWRRSTAADRDAIDAAVARTNITVLLQRRVDELSGGEWQRVRLARALAQGGDAIALDEPTTFLDVGHEMAVFELLGAIAAEGRAVLLVSHQLNLVARFAQHIVLLHRGAIAASGAPSDVMQGEILERVYDWPLVVTRDPAVGAPALVPLRVRPRG